MQFRIWDASENKEYTTRINFISDFSLFGKDYYSRVALEAVCVNDMEITGQIPADFYLSQICSL